MSDTDDDELQQAARIHYSFLPDPINNDEIDLAFRYQPVQAPGGDFCSAFRITNCKLAICLCDVTGHGMDSALYAARINTFVLSHAGFVSGPNQRIVELNHFLHDKSGDTGFYASFLSACLDLERMTTRYSHDPTVPISPGDRLFMYTGNLIGRPNTGNIDEGLDELQTLVSKHSRLDSREFCDAMINFSPRESGAAHDDILVRSVSIKH